ncbi:MAG: tRNA (N(6)-L-threonylcarbamoyladenosine(37)-C(2))-methylthiotransferase MtaB [Lachnospiraceae bacterium]|nr:tRNA (N(6)-L-threonylcarbamoyladenosine(37)-C(2))-methylthiotransferase MtaB [Lachnospiraceae bacterium]
MMKSVALYNLGCKVNSYEMDVMRQTLQENGYRIVPFDEAADIYIVNTCTVTNVADRKSRQMLHRARQLNPKAVVVAAGCYVQTGLKAVEEDPAIDLAVGNNLKKDIVPILEKYLETRQAAGESPRGDKTLQGTTILDMGQACEYERMRLKQTAEHTRAYIKIQDGCNQFCSYCAIPYARGRVRSRRMEDVLEEVRGLADAGCREMVLTGIHISSYGIDFGPGGRCDGCGGLVELAERMQEIDGVERIRLGSLEPRIITAETAGRLSAIEKLCPHFHLSLQSGCDATLKRMNRHYTTGEYYHSVELLRECFEEPAITTDVIVGFPGETREEFQRTKKFLEKVRFYEMHVFKYSKRAKTAAASMPDQVPESVKAQRSAELIALRGRQSEAFRRRYIGKEAEVLLEERRGIDGRIYCIGHTKDYVKVAIDVTDRQERDIPAVNELVKVRIRDFLTEEILM